MAKPNIANFEIPAEMRAFAETGVQQARQACESFIAAAQAVARNADRQAAGAHAGAMQLSSLAMGFAEQNIAASFDFAKRLASAKDPGEVLTLQAEYLKDRIAALNEQGKALGREATRMTNKSASP
jgi:phasin